MMTLDRQLYLHIKALSDVASAYQHPYQLRAREELRDFALRNTALLIMWLEEALVTVDNATRAGKVTV